MADSTNPARTLREPVLSPVDRVSEMLFGLFMALTFTGAVSVADQGDAQIRTMFIAALGCNLAWGLVDAVMYLVRTVTDRGRLLTLIRSVRAAPDAQAGCATDRAFAVEGGGGPGHRDRDRGDSRARHGAARRAGAPRAEPGRCAWPRWRSS